MVDLRNLTSPPAPAPSCLNSTSRPLVGFLLLSSVLYASVLPRDDTMTGPAASSLRTASEASPSRKQFRPCAANVAPVAEPGSTWLAAIGSGNVPRALF